MRQVLFFLIAMCPATASAQVNEPANFPAERLRLSLNREGIIDVEWGRVLPHLSWDVGLWLNYAHDPLVLS